jgi:hypothetical protein
MTPQRTTRLVLALLLAGLACHPSVAGEQAAGKTGIQSKEFLSAVQFIDDKYKSMEGPYTSQRIFLVDGPERELLWMTGFETTVVDQKGTEPLSQEFLCHSNLDLSPEVHQKALGLPARPFTQRAFLNSQGLQKIEFPPGFGLPIASDEPLLLNTQVVNHNVENPRLKVRQKVTVTFARQRDLEKPMKPLYQAQALVMVSVDGHETYVGTDDPSAAQHGASCAVGEPAGGPGASHKGQVEDSLGQRFTAHWVIDKGRSEYHTLVTEPLGLQFDTTVHYIAVHLHAFAESMELRDLTAGKSLFYSNVRNMRGKVGLEHVEAYSSEEGIPLFKDHDYELVAVYNNTSGQKQDSMAVMILYLLDKEFRPENVATASR